MQFIVCDSYVQKVFTWLGCAPEVGPLGVQHAAHEVSLTGQRRSRLVFNPTRTGQHASTLALQQSKCFSVSAPSIPQCTHSRHLQLERVENMQAVSTISVAERQSKTCIAHCQSVSACQRIISISGRGKAAFAEPPRQQRASCRYPLVPLLVRLASNSCDRRL